MLFDILTWPLSTLKLFLHETIRNMFVLRCLYKSAYFIFTFWVKKISNFIPCISNNDFYWIFHIIRTMLSKSQNALWNMVPLWHVIIHFLPQWPLCHWVLVLVSFAVYFFCQSWTFLSIKEEHSDWWCEVFQGVWDFLRAPDFFEAPKNSFLWRSSKSLKNHLLVVPEPGWSNSQCRIYCWSSNYMYQNIYNFY